MSSGPVQILIDKGVSQEKRYWIDKEALDKVIRSANLPPGTRISVLVISGIFRLGKSFVLNLLLRYLHTVPHGQPIPDNWWKEPPSTGVDNCFEWRGGCDVHTRGIWIWPHPFMIPDRVALFLMDCEGLFHSACDSKQLLTISVLASSTHIGNVSSQGIGDYLKYLEQAAQEVEKRRSRRAVRSIQFLVRDWPRPVQFPYGAQGGSGYLEEILPSKDDTSLNKVFSVKEGFLLPYPGSDVAEAEEFADVAEIEVSSRFKATFSEFCVNLFSGKLLQVYCRDNGKPLKPEEYPAHLDRLVKELYYPPTNLILRLLLWLAFLASCAYSRVSAVCHWVFNVVLRILERVLPQAAFTFLVMKPLHLASCAYSCVSTVFDWLFYPVFKSSVHKY